MLFILLILLEGDLRDLLFLIALLECLLLTLIFLCLCIRHNLLLLLLFRAIMGLILFFHGLIFNVLALA